MKRRRSSTGNFTPNKRPRFTRSPKGRLFDNTEKKNIDNTSGMITFNQTTANTLLCNAVDDGTLATQRIGRRITMTSLEYRFAGAMAPTTTGASPLRLTIIYDRQPNGVLPTAAQAFAADSIHSMMNLNNSKRFKVLVDEIIPGIGTAGPQEFIIKGFRDFTGKGRKPGLPAEYQSSNGDITDITTGAIVAFVWQLGGLLVANPTNLLYTRVRFTDK